MTYEEALKELKFKHYYDKNNPSISLAIEALEKQVPKKPYAKRNEAICPNCGQTLTEFFEFSIKTPYCDRCGQAIDWSDYE